MDDLDYKILNILQRNGRITVKQIAEECFISSPSVSVRLQNLENNSYIKNYQAMVNYQKLGYSIKAYVNCAVNAKDKDAFYQYIEAIPNVVECDCITGDYSMLLKVYFPNTVDLDNLLMLCKDLVILRHTSSFLPMSALVAFNFKPMPNKKLHLLA